MLKLDGKIVLKGNAECNAERKCWKLMLKANFKDNVKANAKI